LSDESTTPAPEASAPATSGQPVASTQQTTEQSQTEQPKQQSAPAPDLSERYKSQINGMRPYVDPLREAGISDPNQVKELLRDREMVQKLRSRGLDINSLLGDQAQPQQQTQQQDDPPLTRSGLARFFEEHTATQQHESADAAATDRLKAFSQEVGGDYSNDVWDIVLIEAGRYLKENGQRYPVDHPLYEKSYVPPNDSDLEQIKSLVKQRLDRIRGAAARTGIDQSVTQQSTPNGNPNEGAQPAMLGRKEVRVNRINDLMSQHLASLNGESASNS